VPCREHSFKALGYGAHSQSISQFYLHTPWSSANRINHTCLCLPSRSWYSFTDPRGMEGWVGLGDWLHTKINVQHWELNLDMVTHRSTNQTRRRCIHAHKYDDYTTVLGKRSGVNKLR